jgi:hypothetical protein
MTDHTSRTRRTLTVERTEHIEETSVVGDRSVSSLDVKVWHAPSCCPE